MTTKSTTIALYLAINEQGEFMISYGDLTDAVKELNENYSTEAVRTMTINVTVDLPTVELVAVTVPAETKMPAEVTVS